MSRASTMDALIQMVIHLAVMSANQKQKGVLTPDHLAYQRTKDTSTDVQLAVSMAVRWANQKWRGLGSTDYLEQY